VLNTTTLGSSDSDTIIGGVVFLYTSGSWPLALIVLVASVMIPLGKLVALAYLLITVQRGSIESSRERTRLYRMVEFIGRWFQSELVNDLVSGISDLGLPAQAGESEMVVPPNALLITGQFVDVNEGNRARRLVVGLGVGQAAIDTKLQVISHAASGQRVLAEFTTHTDSGEMPGAAITMGAGAAAQGGATAGMAVANMGISGFKAYRSSLDPMIDRTAKKIVAQLSQYFANQGWISLDKVQQPSFLGQ
jgi:hypothetical protein